MLNEKISEAIVEELEGKTGMEFDLTRIEVYPEEFNPISCYGIENIDFKIAFQRAGLSAEDYKFFCANRAKISVEVTDAYIFVSGKGENYERFYDFCFRVTERINRMLQNAFLQLAKQLQEE